MRTRIVMGVVLSAAAAGAFAALSFSQVQPEPTATPSTPAAAPAASPTATPAETPSPESKPAVDFSKMTPLQRQMHLAARHGIDWLVRANRADGRFAYGYLPALHKPLDGDHYLRQAGAAFALARGARFSGDERHAAVARQAVLTLLTDTAVDPQTPGVRHTTWPSIAVNRLAAAGLIVLAVSELPSPGADLLDQSEQLCAFIRGQQQPDGSLRFTDPTADGAAAAPDPDGVNYYPGEALYGLARSQLHRPAAWKTEVVRKALAYYRPWWQTHKNMAFVPWQAAAYAEACLLTKEKAFADAVYEMADWLCDLQYTQLDPHHPLWVGGFMGWADDKPAGGEPQVTSASYAEGLAEACRVARFAGDLPRYQRYRSALERCLQFLTTMQFTEANTTHFADWYRPVLLGGFHASHQDGTLRIDFTQHAVCALVQYLSGVAD